MPSSHARFTTPNGSKYLQQLCKHWSHKTEVEFTPSEGRVALSAGPVLFAADDAGLDMTVEADDITTVEKLQHVVESHLARFAFREEMPPLAWS